MALRLVGFFREVRERLCEHPHGLPSIHDAIRPTPHPDAVRIVSYLEEGVCLWAGGGYMRDVLDPSRFVRGGPDYLTDGVWCWPREFAYYAAEYNVVPPDEFVADMRRNGWVVPALSQATRKVLAEEIASGWRAAEQRQADPDAAADGGGL